jgi:GNAT superfamily N-acetyltransferase
LAPWREKDQGNQPVAETTVIYRRLQRHEAYLLGRVDRSERIDGVYRHVGGRLHLDGSRTHVVDAWDTSELTRLISRLEALIESGGHAYAAWDDAKIVGLAALDVRGVNGDKTVLKLEMLYVSAGYRGRGIGRTLTYLLANEARSCGAKALYISATPTHNTVDSYLHMGAELLDSPDPALLAEEPEDIHLIIGIE